MGNTLASHPDVYLGQQNRGLVIRDNQKSSAKHHMHWVRAGSTHNLAANEFHTSVFGSVNSAGLFLLSLFLCSNQMVEFDACLFE
jgi:hypothetical protein